MTLRYSFIWLCLLTAWSTVSFGQNLIVSPEGDVTTLRQAMALANDGQRIVMQPGVYIEHDLDIDKSVHIEGTGEVIIDGDENSILRITADSVVLTGLTFRNVGTSFVDDRAAVKVDGAHHCHIENNRFDDTFFAVYLAKSAHCSILNNRIQGAKSSESRSGNGIHLWYSKNAHIAGNTVRGHRDGIYMEFVEDSEIIDNLSEHNMRYGLHFMFSDRCSYRNNTIKENDAGVAVMYSKNVEMEGNTFEGNWGSAAYGLLLKDITDSRIVDNAFLSNTIGIYAEGSNRMEVSGNRFARNGWALKLMANSIENVFSGNQFESNTFDVATNSRQTYSRFDGNYWDKYQGYDLDHDGVGDVPFRPVRLFSLLTEQNEPAIILLNSFFVDLLDAAERILPALTPDTLIDEHPAMEKTL